MENNGNSTINIASWPREPLTINRSGDQTVSIKGQVPICIRLCEPICVRSDYTIGITIFDRPVATISVTGQTRFFNCEENR